MPISKELLVRQLPDIKMKTDLCLEQLSAADMEFYLRIISGDLGKLENLLQLIDNSRGKVNISAIEMQTTSGKRSEVDGRTVYLELDKPIEVDNKRLTVLRFKGVRPRVNHKGQAFTYSNSGMGIVPRAPRVDSGGNLYIIKGLDHPQGGIENIRAKHEWDVMVVARSLAFTTDYPIGQGEYIDKKFGDLTLGFVVAGMTWHDRRLTHIPDEGKDKVHLGIRDLPSGKAFSRTANQTEWESQLMFNVGRQFKLLHDFGMYHRYPHLLNIGLLPPNGELSAEVVIRDLDGAFERQSFEGDEAAKLKQEVGYRFIDLAKLVLNLASEVPVNEKMTTWRTLDRLIPSLTSGYFDSQSLGSSTTIDNLSEVLASQQFASEYNRFLASPSLRTGKIRDTVDTLKIDSGDRTFGVILQALTDVLLRDKS